MQRCLGLLCGECRERSAFARSASALVLAPYVLVQVLIELLPRVLRACGDLINRHDGMVYEQLAPLQRRERRTQRNRLDAAGLRERRRDYRAR